MDESNDYRQSAKDAHKLANQAAESSRQHANDLDKIIRSAKSKSDMLTDGQDRQNKREQSSAPTARAKASLRNASIRLRAMESQLTSAFNYCSTADNALTILGRVEHARRATERARHVAEVVRAHLNEPNHVPADSVAGIKKRLAELDEQIAIIKARLWEQPAK